MLNILVCCPNIAKDSYYFVISLLSTYHNLPIFYIITLQAMSCSKDFVSSSSDCLSFVFLSNSICVIR